MDQNWSSVSWSKDNSGNRTSGGAKKAAPKNQRSAEQKTFQNLDDADEAGHHEKVSHDTKMLIMKGRMAKKMSQDQLAKALNIKKQTINEYEQGKAIPNQQVL